MGVGCGFHLEAAVDWSTVPAAVVADRDIYTGFELVFDVAAGEQTFPVGLGLTFRFDPSFATPPNWGRTFGRMSSSRMTALRAPCSGRASSALLWGIEAARRS